jgi:hypothetical protein
LVSIIPLARSSHDDTDAFKKLHTFTEQSLQFESKRLKEELTETGASFELTALFRPTTDGYAFTDMTLKDPSAGPATNLRKYLLISLMMCFFFFFFFFFFF